MFMGRIDATLYTAMCRVTVERQVPKKTLPIELIPSARNPRAQFVFEALFPR